MREINNVTIFVDGAIGDGRAAGAAAVARDAGGRFQGWISRKLPPMTNNEAEYHGALLGLELAGRLAAGRVLILSDSAVVVEQMEGRSRVNSARLRRLHRRLVQAARRFERVEFRHVPREENRLADALAAEALADRPVAPPPAPPAQAPWWRRVWRG